MRKALKLIGWLCLFCVVIIGGWFSVKILAPSLKSPRASTPYLEFHLALRRVSTVAFTPDGKQFLCTYHPKGFDEIKRWNVSDGSALPPFVNRDIHLLSDDGRYYVANDDTNHLDANQLLYRVSDQKVVSSLPDNTKDRSLTRIIGGKHPFAIYYYCKMAPAQDSNLFDLSRRYFIWDIETKHFISNKPHTMKLHDFSDNAFKDVAFSNDGTKVLSLWPTYTRTLPPTYEQNRSEKTLTVTKSFIPWFDPIYRQKPKYASLLNEIDGSIIKLPLAEDSLPFYFGWVNPTLSSDQQFFAAVGLNFSYLRGGSTADGDGKIWCYDLAQRELKWKYYPGKVSSHFLRFSPNGAMLAIGGDDLDYRFQGSGFLCIIDTKTGKLLHSFTEQTIGQQIFDRTRVRVLDNLLYYYNSLTRNSFESNLSNPEFFPAPGNSGRIQDIAWSPDSKLLAASYEDGSVKIWRVKE
jgi:WD40 repeat protein